MAWGESPRRPVLRWNRLQRSVLLALCLLVALASSWPWLVQPDIRPGLTAPFDAVAPKDARVVDREALKQQRSSLVPSTLVQVIDDQQDQQLRMRLERYLGELERVASSDDAERIGPVNLTIKEQRWLEERSAEERLSWDMALRRALDRMLSQGLVNNLAEEQLRQATSLQLDALGVDEVPARTLGSKLLTSTVQGASNLKTDPQRSQRLIEKLITQQGIPVIEVSQGDLITQKGEPISSQAYDVLDFFGLVNRRPKLGIWLVRFTESLAGCGVLLLVMRRERPCLEAPHGLLALGLLLISQACKVWFGCSREPSGGDRATDAPAGAGPGNKQRPGLAGDRQPALAHTGHGPWRRSTAVAAATATVAALQAGRIRSRAQLLQLAVLLPLGALVVELLLLNRTAEPLVTTDWSRLLPNSGDLSSEALLLGLLMMLAILVIPLAGKFLWSADPSEADGAGRSGTTASAQTLLRGAGHLRAHPDDLQPGRGGRARNRCRCGSDPNRFAVSRRRQTPCAELVYREPDHRSQPSH